MNNTARMMTMTITAATIRPIVRRDQRERAVRDDFFEVATVDGRRLGVNATDGARARGSPLKRGLEYMPKSARSAVMGW